MSQTNHEADCKHSVVAVVATGELLLGASTRPARLSQSVVQSVARGSTRGWGSVIDLVFRNDLRVPCLVRGVGEYSVRASTRPGSAGWEMLAVGEHCDVGFSSSLASWGVR